MPETDFENVERAPRSRSRRGRSENYARWVGEPLQIFLRDELARLHWSVSDLSRESGFAPSVVSRWMQGVTPSARSLQRLSTTLGVDEDTLLTLAGHRESKPADDDPRRAALVAKIKQIDLTEERYALLESLLETMRRRPVGQRDQSRADRD